ncbi:MAG: antibiotic biosynthesis monooxygenase family protein [bacterium]|nr:antibiotic biosynthesis monooxygenase family protein [bacterium]
MINRIVRMSFEPEKVEEFLALFNSVKHQIANFEGCEGLTLLKDSVQPNVLFTYSYWQSEAHLNKYRFSELFKKTWLGTKILFNDAPIAWSLLVEQQVK